MKTILAADKNWAIGKNNNLLVHISGDLKYFKQKTLGKVIVMGRKTLESLPGGKPLPGRTTLVLSGNKNFDSHGCAVFQSLEALTDELKNYDDDNIFIAGGENVYSQFYPLCDTFLITKIMAEFDADTYYINLDREPGLECIYESEIQEENGIKYIFTEYRRKKHE